MHTKTNSLLKLCSVLPALLVMPAMAKNVTWNQTDDLVLGAADKYSIGIDGLATGKISGSGTIEVTPSKGNTVFTLDGDISDFNGKFYAVQYAVTNQPNNVSSIIVNNRTRDGFVLEGNGNFIFAGTEDVKIVSMTPTMSSGAIFLNGNTLVNDENGTNIKGSIFVGGKGVDDTGRDVTLKNYQLDNASLYISGSRNETVGDLNATILGEADSKSTYKSVSGLANNTKMTGDVNLYLENVKVATMVAGQAGGSGEKLDRSEPVSVSNSKVPTNTIIVGDINIVGKNIEATSVYGQAFSANGEYPSGIEGDINITLEDSVVGDVRGVNLSAGDYVVWNKEYYKPAENINIVVKDSLIKSELLATGSYSSAGNVKIDVLGDTVIGYTSKDAKIKNGDGWIIAGAQKPGARIDNTEVNLNTAGLIKTSGDVNVGSREKEEPQNSDEGSVLGDAVLNMFGGGNIEIGGDVRAYHVAGNAELNLDNIEVVVDGTIKEFTTINMTDSASLYAGALSLTANDTLNVALMDTDNYSKISVGTLDANGAKLNMLVKSVGEYNVVSAENIVSDFDWNLTNVMYDLSYDAGTVIASLKSVQDIAADNNLTSDAANVITVFANSDSNAMQQVSLMVQEALNQGDAKVVEQELAKANPEVKPVAQSVATSVQGQVLSVASGRMSAVGGAATGRSGGDVTAAGAWAQGMFNKSKMADKFHGYTRGFAIGGDTQLNNSLTMGVGYAFSNTDVHSGGRTMDVETNSVFVYGQYKPSQWYVNGTISYAESEYSEDAGMIFGVYNNSSEYEVKSYGAQLMGGYDFVSGVSPVAGLRYLHVAQEEYTNGLGLDVQASDTDYMMGVLGVNYAFAIETESAFQIRPELRAAMTYDFIYDDAVTTVVMPGAPSYYVYGDRLSRIGGEFGIGLTMNYRDLDVSLNYDIEVREDYTSQTGMLKFRYDF